MQEIIKALIECQKEFHNLSKDKQGYGYKYVELNQILNEVKPVLNKHGIFLSQNVGCMEMENNSTMTAIQTILYHVSGENLKTDIMPLEATTMKGVNNMQAMGASITYARRYQLIALLGLADEDTDGLSKNEIKQRQVNFPKKENQAEKDKLIAQIQEELIDQELDDSQKNFLKGINTQPIQILKKALENIQNKKKAKNDLDKIGKKIMDRKKQNETFPNHTKELTLAEEKEQNELDEIWNNEKE